MNRPHRAWLVCLGGALTLLSTIGLGVNVFAVYQPDILAWSTLPTPRAPSSPPSAVCSSSSPCSR